MRMRRGVFQVSFALVLAGCSFEASCGGKKLDSKKIAADLGGRIQEAGGLPATVSCPESKLVKGAVIACTTDVQGVKGRVNVTQTDDQGNVTIDVVEGYVFSAKIEQIIGQRLEEQTGVDGKVDCGERVRASVAGARFRCTATADVDGDKLALEVTMTNATGGFDFAAVEDAPAAPAAPAEAPPAAPAE